MFITGLWPTTGSVVARHHISTKALFSSTVQALSSISFFSIIRFTLSKDAKYVCMYVENVLDIFLIVNAILLLNYCL